MAFFSDAFAGRRILVTGHTGFKGSWLTSWLLDLGAQVCGYSDTVPTSPSLFELGNLGDRIDHQLGDVRDLDRFAQVLSSFRPDAVFHLAAQAIVSTSYRNPLDTISTNVMGTATVLEAMRQVDWPCVGVIITSDKCYENVEWPWGYRETDRLGGKDVYSASKGAAELVFHAYLHSFFSKADSPVRLATARAGNVVGGGDWAADRIVVDCVTSWMDGRSVEIRSPRATRPWQHVLEPLSGYLALGAKLLGSGDLHGESYNFGPAAEQNRTVVELIGDLAKEWGSQDSESGYRITADIPFHEAGLLKLSCDKALMDLRWQPTLNYEECIALTGGWYRRVLREQEDAFAVTAEQVRAYERLATERRRVWSGE
ncbi:MAG TPA: CDP-glucose 4,6-dehydratase [Allosphingosinicella sp.]|nr:CDP-glucose 4,6-dehydratase [Allosphingosinicella sp.]